VIFTLADYAFAIASNTDGRTSTGLQTNIAFIPKTGVEKRSLCS
jgi:acyl-coenzyme A thioesterase PaaI-like protein